MSGVRWAFTSTEQANWHPLTWLSHMLDVQLFGLHAAGHHLTSVALHLANTLLLFAVLREMTRATSRSAIVAAFFAFHPLHVESVAWIAERKDVLSTTFLLLALHAYVRYVDRPTGRRYIAVAAFFMLGLMAKPMLVTFPFLLLLLDFWPLGRLTPSGRIGWTGHEAAAHEVLALPRLLAEKIPLIALSAAVSAVTLYAQRGTMGTLEQYSLSQRLANASLSYVVYARKMIWPVDLACFYPYASAISPAVWMSALAVLGAVSLVAVRARRSHPAVFVGWFWYVGMLVPVIGLVQVGEQSMADRYTYLPLVGLFIAIVWVAADALARHARPMWGFLTTGIILAACFGMALQQVAYWRDNATLFAHAVAVTKDNYIAYVQIGARLHEEGRTAEAVRYYDAALRAKPDDAQAHNNLGLLLATSGDTEAAMQHYAEALRIDPLYADAHYNRGVLLHGAGASAEAAAEYRSVLAIAPTYAQAHSNLGLILYDQRQIEAALGHLAEAVALRPDYFAAHNNYGIVLRAAGQLDAALTQYNEALRIDPASADAHYNLGNLLLQRGDLGGAIAQYRETLRLKPSYTPAQEMLNNALAHGSG